MPRPIKMPWNATVRIELDGYAPQSWGPNDGLLSTASLVLGVAAAHGSHGKIPVAGTAGLVAGSMSMAAETCSVYSQADTETAHLEREKIELSGDPWRTQGTFSPTRAEVLTSKRRTRWRSNSWLITPSKLMH